MIKSTDGGETWSALQQDLDPDVHQIIVHPTEPDRLLISTGGGHGKRGDLEGLALYRSEDAGATWSPMAMEFDQEYSVPIVMHPTNPDILYSALARGPANRWTGPEGADGALIKSSDGGSSWQALDAGAKVSAHYAAAIAIHPSNPDRVYVSTRKGELFESRDGGTTWSDLDVEVPSVNVVDLKAVEV